MIPIRDTAPCNSTPYVTWSLMAVCILIFLIMQVIPYELSYKIIYLYGMVPNRYANPGWGLANGMPFDGYLSFLTSLFLHGNWLHIIFNMWFMWIFADNVEDRMGRWQFLAFYLICGLLATALQWYSAPTLQIPVVGASGAIAGVLAPIIFSIRLSGLWCSFSRLLCIFQRLLFWACGLFFSFMILPPPLMSKGQLLIRPCGRMWVGLLPEPSCIAFFCEKMRWFERFQAIIAPLKINFQSRACIIDLIETLLMTCQEKYKTL
jgi:membrane associated rhomboid family serine protease